VEAIASGPVSCEEVRTHLLEERSKHGLGYAELIDGRSANPNWSTSQTREIVELLRNFGLDSRLGPTAVVVPNDYAFGMLRMLEILLEDICIVRPFRDFDAAKQWLRCLP
jgi:hypothetical protein